MPPHSQFAYLLRPTIKTRAYRRYRMGPGIERPTARVVVAVLLGLFVLAIGLLEAVSHAGPSEEALALAHLTPQQIMGDTDQFYLPTPVAVLPADRPEGPPVPDMSQSADFGSDRVRVVDPGGAGVLLRSQPSNGKLVASLRNDQVLEVLDRQTVDQVVWLRVRTAEGVEGWVFAGLVLPTY
ncbi:MAG: SH3 domain-containing protein [Chloroflexi bacterium]|nr:SH3 domain-containing protein [Chloroflexota bacterium]MBV9601441.1 SH3 domain-containing protein [Chloroflexota bacterium]